jgi:arsenate reductase (thioredoxin)
MAEAWTRHLKGRIYDPYSAGIDARGLDPRAIKVMGELGIDISIRRSKNIDTLNEVEFDYVITVCDHAKEACPFFPAKTRLLHWGFPDPPLLSEGAQTEEEALQHYRRVRDEIRALVERFPEILSDSDDGHE